MVDAEVVKRKERSVPPNVSTQEEEDNDPVPYKSHSASDEKQVKELFKAPDEEEDDGLDDYFDEERESDGVELRDLDDDEFEELITEAFNDVDEENSGVIATEHLGSILDALAEDGVMERILDEEELDLLKNDMDADHNGLVPLSEFKDVLMRRRAGSDFTDDELREAFGVFDHRHKGKFTSVQFRQIMLAFFHKDVPNLDAKSMVMAASADSKDEIDFEEFKSIIQWKSVEHGEDADFL